MRIIREDLKTGVKNLVAGYDSITLELAKKFMEGFAQKEADDREDVKHLSLDSYVKHGLIIHRITLTSYSTASLVVYNLVI